MRLLAHPNPGQPELPQMPSGPPVHGIPVADTRGTGITRLAPQFLDGRPPVPLPVLGLRMTSFSSARRAAWRATVVLRFSFLAILLFFAIRPSPLVP